MQSALCWPSDKYCKLGRNRVRSTPSSSLLRFLHASTVSHSNKNMPHLLQNTQIQVFLKLEGCLSVDLQFSIESIFWKRLGWIWIGLFPHANHCIVPSVKCGTFNPASMPPALPTMPLSFLKMCMAEEGLDCTKCKQIGSLRVAVPQKSNGRERLSFRERLHVHVGWQIEN